MTASEPSTRAADLPGLAEQLHTGSCANPSCAGRGPHEVALQMSFLAMAEANLAAGWTPPRAASGADQTISAPGGAVVVSVRPTRRPEPKVLAAALWSVLAPGLAEVCMWLVENPSALNGPEIPDWARAGVLTLAGAFGALLGGYRAKHDTSRVRVTPVGDAAETQVIPLGPMPVAAQDAEASGEFALRQYREHMG